MAYTTGILLFDGAEELDFVGPLEVFGMARQDGDRVVTIAQTAEPVRANLGLRVLPDHTLGDAPPLDVLVVPGGLGTRKEADNAVLLDWIKQAAAGCTWLTSVCTGSMLLEAAGVVDRLNVTTHWAMIDTFREKGTVNVLDSRRYVRHGNVVTAAGVSAGIDMSLWVVGQLYGIDHARNVQRMMEYDPAPPYAADV
jgi:transcriptional regulator GlxA family with amidase domain